LIAVELRTQLIAGSWKPGSRLNEFHIADVLGISRNTVREAFAELCAQRLLVRVPKEGFHVASPNSTDLQDIFTARRVIELSSVRSGGNPERIQAAQKAAADYRGGLSGANMEKLHEQNLEFHRVLVTMAMSVRLSVAMNQLLDELRLFHLNQPLDAEFHSQCAAAAAEIAQALKQNDFDEAAALLSKDLDTTEQHILAVHNSSEPPVSDTQGKQPKY
jgi:DNA-binding GntR family transcriptional regulator